MIGLTAKKDEMNRCAAYLHTIGFSQRELSRIFKDNTDYKQFFDDLDPAGLQSFSIKPNRAAEIISNRSELDKSDIDRILSDKGVKIITLHDEGYPENLRYMPNPPFILYVRGDLKDMNLLSVVGSRKCTPYSEASLKHIIPGLIRNGFGIVSGGAYGVDSIAHNLTLQNSGYTICVVGTGIDIDYPAINSGLYDKIIENGGAMVSIFRLGTRGAVFNFPIRNEIIAGISKGTIVTEAKERSGTLITARLALELNKDVFVVPGDIHRETSMGSNSLIRDGLSKAILGYEDILSEYSLCTRIEDKKIVQMSLEDSIEQSILESLSESPLDASSISDKLQKDVSTVSFKLSIMEVRGDIRLGESGLYHLN